MACARELASFECSMCGKILETWNSAWVPTYRFIVGPIVKLPNGERPIKRAPRCGGSVRQCCFLGNLSQVQMLPPHHRTALGIYR